jgi:molybdopterin synthase catalytic subunit
MEHLDLAAMRVQVLYFAAFRDAVGRDKETRDVPEGSTVADFWGELVRQVPYFARFPAMPPAAVNQEYMEADTALRDGDEVAFLPPVAGG